MLQPLLGTLGHERTRIVCVRTIATTINEGNLSPKDLVELLALEIGEKYVQESHMNIH